MNYSKHMYRQKVDAKSAPAGSCFSGPLVIGPIWPCKRREIICTGKDYLPQTYEKLSDCPHTPADRPQAQLD